MIVPLQRTIGTAGIFILAFLLLSGEHTLYGQPGPSRLTSSYSAEQLYSDGQYRRSLLFRRSSDDSFRSWESKGKLEKASALFYEGLLLTAEQEIEDVLTERYNDQVSGRAWLLRGKVALKAKKYGQARLYFNEAIASVANEQSGEQQDIAGSALYWIGLSHALETKATVDENAQDALTTCVTQYKYSSRTDDALFLLGQLAEARGDYPAATQYYEELLSDYPNSEYKLVAGISHIQNQLLIRNYKEAFAQLDRSELAWSKLQQDEKATTQLFHENIDEELKLLRGETSIGLADYPAAELAYLDIVYHNDGLYRREAMLGLADTYLAAGRPDSAQVLYRRIIDQGIDDRAGRKAEFFEAVAMLDVAGSKEAGVETLQRIGEQTGHPMATIAQLKLAELAYRNKDYATTVALGKDVLGGTPSEPYRLRASLLYGSALLSTDYPEEAVDVLMDAEQLALKITSEVLPERDYLLATARLLTAQALVQSGRSSEAISRLNTFLQRHSADSRAHEAQYWVGEAYYQSGLYSAAVEAMETLVDRYSTSPYIQNALYTLGWAQFKQRKFPDSESAFARLVKAYPLSRFAAEGQLRRGDCFYLTKNYKEAVHAYRQVMNMDPAPELAEYAQYQAAVAEYQQGDKEKSQSSFKIFVENYPQSLQTDDAVFMIGLIDFRDEKYEKALATMNELIEEYPESNLQARAYYTIGDSYYKLGDFEASYAAYSIVTERFPHSTYRKDAQTGMIYARAAEEQSKQQEDQTAVMAVAEESDLYTPVPQEKEIELRRAEIYQNANRINDAINEYRKFLAASSSSPNVPVGMMGIADAYMIAGDTATALDTLASMTRRYPKSSLTPMVMLKLGEHHLNKGDTTKGMGWITGLKVQYPRTAAASRATTRQVRIYRETGRTAEAKSVLRAYLPGIDTVSGYQTNSGVEIYSMLASLEEADGEYDSAATRWKFIAQRQDSTGLEAGMNVARCLDAAKQHRESITAYEALIEQSLAFPELNARAWLGMGKACEGVGESERAAEIYQSVLQRHESNQYGKEAERRLGMIRRP